MSQLEPLKFIKGMDQKPDPEMGDWQDITNLDISKIGIARATRVNSTVRTHAATIHSFCVGSLSTTEKVLDGAGTSLYDSATEIKSGFSGEKLSGTSQNSRLYVTNPTDGLWMYSGTAWMYSGATLTHTGATMYRAGATIPSVAAAASITMAGGFTGDYSIVVTYTNRNGYVGNPSPAVDITLSSDKISLTSIPVNSNAEYDIVSRQFWIFGGTTPLYTNYVKLGSVNNNTATGYRGDTGLGIDTTEVDTLDVLEQDNDLPYRMKSIVSHYDTFFGIGIPGSENYLAYSKTGKGEQWPADQLFKISRPGDYPRGLLAWDGVLWLGTPSKIFQLIGSPGSGILSTNFYLKETRTKKGFLTQNGNIATPYGIYYMCEDGIFKFDGTESEHVSHNLQSIFDRLSLSAIEQTCGCYFDNKFFMSFPVDSSTINNITAIYDFETDQWFTHDVGYRAFYPDYVNNDLYVANETNVEKYQGGSTYTNWSVKTKDLSAGVGQYSSFNEYEVDLDATCTCNVYLDDTLASTESLVTTGREVVTRTFPNQMARRAAIELIGAAKSTQDKLYSIRVSAEIIGEKGEP